MGTGVVKDGSRHRAEVENCELWIAFVRVRRRGVTAEEEEVMGWESHERLTALLAAPWYLVVKRWVWRGTKEQTRANVDIAGVWCDVN